METAGRGVVDRSGRDVAAGTRRDLPEIFARVGRRLRDEVDRPVGRELAEVVRSLTGLRTDVTAETVESMMGTFAELSEQSSTYQATIGKGEVRGEARGEAKAKRDLERVATTRSSSSAAADGG